MRRVIVSVLVAAVVAGCSSSGKSPSDTAGDIGQTKPAASPPGSEGSVPLGSPIWKGALLMSIAGPVTIQRPANGKGLMVFFNVTMTNTAVSGDIDGPKGFMVRCDANRDAKNDVIGDYWQQATTVAGKTIPAGQTVSGVAAVPWLTQESKVRCAGPTTIEAQWPKVGYLAWTLPVDVVTRVNAAV